MSDPFEQGDEAIDEETRLDPSFTDELEQDPSLDPTLQGDDRELDEADARLDDPERVAYDGAPGDPDGPVETENDDADEGWNLDAPVTVGDAEPDAEPEQR